jgi:hypothetical protein
MEEAINNRFFTFPSYLTFLFASQFSPCQKTCACLQKSKIFEKTFGFLKAKVLSSKSKAVKSKPYAFGEGFDIFDCQFKNRRLSSRTLSKNRRFFEAPYAPKVRVRVLQKSKIFDKNTSCFFDKSKAFLNDSFAFLKELIKNVVFFEDKVRVRALLNISDIQGLLDFKTFAYSIS